ncbi:glycoside hydrolase family 2 protein [Roseococcus pinisoli]|uniref:Glycoside hydrolase family 2 protein n=1 Tax=Roseococcus pinisoli TaxID=2835040 RepID=A0ABS5QEC3_9PROT|nr:glycoside hydrolase family 2 protein [Roseococcus pinisoli]MBS7811733.1 glycoside hydrolase family 2 protein [Roseococcus pinisoli]
MARIHTASHRLVTHPQHWQLAVLPPGKATHPAELPAGTEWITAEAPGTAGAALKAAGRAIPDLDAMDCWFRADIPAGPEGRILRCEGLATLAELWLGDQLLLASDSMFLPQEAAIPASGGVLQLRCRALASPAGIRRPRWRPALMRPTWLRGIRTALQGRMPGSFPGPAAVGPWREIELLTWKAGAPRVTEVDLRATLDEAGNPRLSVSLRTDATAGRLLCGGEEAPLRPSTEGLLAATLELPGLALWWPHTHGEPALHEVAVELGGTRIELGRTGFRRIEVDTGAGGRGFGLVVNDIPIFCRGGVWAGADPTTQGGDPLPFLRAARDAGLNMIRVSGTGVWESNAFYEACDALGLLAWQDAPMASADFPEEQPAFRAAIEAEATAFLARIQTSPSLAVLCGGSEIAQSAAMNGLPPEAWYGPVRREALPSILGQWRPDVVYVPDSPFGPADELPHRSDAGVAHYFGVGAYLRPLGDARAAGVRFASECLAFANVPAGALDLPPVHHPDWKRGVPRDPSASWDFEDVRDDYLGRLYGVDPSRLRREEPERYLDLSRAVTGDIMETTFAEWRRPASPCRGALVWTLQDVMPGAGWGLLDAAAQPKPCVHALRRACAPLALLLLDEGTNGIALHLLNDGPEPVEGELELACYRGSARVAQGSRMVTVAAHGTLSLPGEALFGRFFDAGYAWRFGPPPCDATHATFRRVGASPDAQPCAEAALYPQDRVLPPATSIRAVPEKDEAGWSLVITAEGFVRGLRIEDENGFRPEVDWLPLPPGQPRRLRLSGPSSRAPQGRVAALNAGSSSYRGVS